MVKSRCVGRGIRDINVLKIRFLVWGSRMDGGIIYWERNIGEGVDLVGSSDEFSLNILSLMC